MVQPGLVETECYGQAPYASPGHPLRCEGNERPTMTDAIEEDIYSAVYDGNVHKVRELFARFPMYFHRRYRDDLSWLAVAIDGQETPLAAAVGMDDCEMARLLLKHGANPNLHRPVIAAIVGIHEHSLEMLQLLEQAGADLHRVYLNELRNQPMNALTEAIAWEKKDVEA
jgi:hypothetical protein